MNGSQVTSAQAPSPSFLFVCFVLFLNCPDFFFKDKCEFSTYVEYDKFFLLSSFRSILKNYPTQYWPWKPEKRVRFDTQKIREENTTSVCSASNKNYVINTSCSIYIIAYRALSHTWVSLMILALLVMSALKVFVIIHPYLFLLPIYWESICHVLVIWLIANLKQSGV